ncbi:MAG TPA: hypothetical protein VHV26_04000 [Rhizomicrobium sp.]|jgi:hypothetical protein|nr:hypothetical protein [Rhizomicrobium sp.]
MRHSLRSAVVAAGFAVAFAALPVRADAPATVSPFSDQPTSPFEWSAASGFTLPSLDVSPLLNGIYGIAAPSFAASTLLSPTLTLDAGRNLDIASRFDSYGETPLPLLSAVTAPYLGLANGGHYAGFTYTPTAQLRLRLGASFNSDWLDHFFADSLATTGEMPLGYRPSLTQSVMAGLSWDFSDFAGLGVTAISSNRDGVPLGFGAGLPNRTSTDAVGVSAHLGLGAGWVTKLSYSEGLSQLDLRGGQTGTDEHSYSIAIAKRGLFGGDDTMGFAFSRPAPSLMGGFTTLTASGDLPPMIIAHGEAIGPQAPETDFQLGYVTNFLDGALALQANAGYQMNYQGQTGATAVSLLSRAKIKF